MRKRDEVMRTDSCFHRALPNEMIFVLLGRDPAAPHAIREWIAERIRLRRNNFGDPQITDALECAEIMEKECKQP